MKFRLGTIAYLFALLAAGMAAFGGIGIFPTVVVVLFWAGFLAGSRRTRDVCLSCALVAGLIVFLLVPMISLTPKGPTSRSNCQSNLRHILLGLGNYESVHGTFPPPYIADADGKPMHSWRVLILPYIEETELFKRYRMDEPWDGPNNRSLWDEIPQSYRCPGCEWCDRLGLEPFGSQPGRAASYFAIVGENAGWSIKGPKTYKELQAGPKSTLFVMERGGMNAPWTAPVDLTAEEAAAALSDPRVPGHPSPWERWFDVGVGQQGANGASVEGRTGALPNTLTAEEAEAAVAIGGADLGALDALPGESVLLEERWRYERIYGVALFAGLALWPGVWVWRRTRAPAV